MTYVPGMHCVHGLHCGVIASSPVMNVCAPHGTQSLQYVSDVAEQATDTLLRSAHTLHCSQLEAAVFALKVPLAHGVEFVAPSML